MSNDLHRLDSNPRLTVDPDDPVARAGREPGPRNGYGYGYPGYSEPASLGGEEPHLRDYLRVLYKRRWIAGTAFTVVFLLVTVYTFTATPIYEAKVKLLIEADNPNIVSFKEVIDEQAAKVDYYQTQYNILQSRSLARRTIDNLKLWDHSEFGAAPGEEKFSFVGFVANAASTATGYVTGLFATSDSAGSVAQPSNAADSSGATRADSSAADPALVVPEETEAQSRAIDAFVSRLRVSPVRNSRIVDVKFRSTDAALSARVVNALAKGYIEQNLEYRFLSSKEASDWLGQQLAAQRRQVEEAEARLQQYREANDAISLEDRQNIYVQKLGELNTAVTRAKTERLEKEALYRQLRDIQTDRAALDTFPAILGNTFIQQQKADVAELQAQLVSLSEKLGDKHPDIIKVRSSLRSAELKLQAEIDKVVQSVRNQYLAAQAQENSLVGALEAQKREALSMNRKGIEYSVLMRDVESGRQLYDSLLQRAKETGVSAELKTSNIRVVDNAEKPRSPASPRRGLNLLLALFGGSMLGLGLAFFFEYLDSNIKTPDEIKTHLGLPSLGMLPALSDKALNGAYPLVSNGVPPNFTEAFRAIRTNVVFSSAEEGCRAVLVTSTGPGEGKTVCAANLAVSLAQAGQRVLLMDGDMRKPKVEEAFRVPKEPGLSNLLVGNAKASDCIRKGPVSGLWLLPAGKMPPNPAE
ncbi:MAG TPA: polysaccharide biosynthesis tyrosine autokinase, partial [Vicinamibacterales bacterium]|nr:polysaccharide biosynthesis tyrosine autokinase [Vicinamibacterales bacterium]